MLKKTIVFTDLDGNPATEDFYFNLTKAEVAQMELEVEGGLANQLKLVIAGGDGGAILATFKDILRRSYGVRSADGKRFIKTEQDWIEFTQTEAFSVLFMDLVTDAVVSSEFIRGILPADLVGKMDAAEVTSEFRTVENTKIPASLALPPTPPSPLEKDPKDMTREELMAAYAAKLKRLSSE